MPDCPVCQTSVSKTRSPLCDRCGWPLEAGPELAIAQVVWLRQMWQQVQQYQTLEAKLAQLPPPPEEIRTTPPSSPTPSVEIDYEPLRKHLSSQRWRDADRVSAEILLQSVGRDRQGYLTPEDLVTLPIAVLNQVDELWQNASEGHFGLSVQKHCHIVLSGNRARITKVWPQLGAALGWCVDGQWLTYDKLTFNLDAPQGHLPVCGDGLVWFVGGWSGASAGFTALMSRLP